MSEASDKTKFSMHRQPKRKERAAGMPPLKPIHYGDVLHAAQWCIRKAEDARQLPDLTRNPNSKLAVIKRMIEEIVRNRRQIEFLVVENDVLKKLITVKEKP